MRFPWDHEQKVLQGETTLRHLGVFLETSHSLVPVGHWNTILDARLDCVELFDRREGAKTTQTRTDWIFWMCWREHGRTASDYLDREFCRPIDKGSISCPLFLNNWLYRLQLLICTIWDQSQTRISDWFFFLLVSFSLSRTASQGLEWIKCSWPRGSMKAGSPTQEKITLDAEASLAVPIVEAQRDKITFQSLVDENRYMSFKTEQICVSMQQHFAGLFGTNGRTEPRMDFAAYISGSLGAMA